LSRKNAAFPLATKWGGKLLFDFHKHLCQISVMKAAARFSISYKEQAVMAGIIDFIPTRRNCVRARFSLHTSSK
jgi:hypothetical protein